MLVDDLPEGIVQFSPLLVQNQCVGIPAKGHTAREKKNNMNCPGHAQSKIRSMKAESSFEQQFCQMKNGGVGACYEEYLVHRTT